MQFQDQYIVRENPILIQKLAKEHSKGMLPKYFIGCLIFYLLMNWIPNILGVFLPTPIWNYINMPRGEIDINMLPAYPMVFFLYAFAFQGVMELGKSLYVITFVRNRSTEYEALLEGFKLYGKALFMSLLKSLIVTMWMFLLIIPGIIANYGFSQAYYILADDPKKGITQCLAESKLRMTGNKMNLFRLDISYFIFILLGYGFESIIGGLLNLTATNLTGCLIYMVIEIPLVCALGWLYLGRGIFYELLISHGFENFRFENQKAFRESRFV